MGADNGRGQGKFYDLYGKGHSAGAMITWAWGVSRIIDALELTPDAKIDPKHVGGKLSFLSATASGTLFY